MKNIGLSKRGESDGLEEEKNRAGKRYLFPGCGAEYNIRQESAKDAETEHGVGETLPDGAGGVGLLSGSSGAPGILFGLR